VHVFKYWNYLKCKKQKDKVLKLRNPIVYFLFKKILQMLWTSAAQQYSKSV